MFRFAGYYFAALFGLALLAFWKSYVRELPGELDPYTHVHAIVMILWFAITIAQPFLIRRDQRALHRLLGRVSYAIVPLFAITTLLLTRQRLGAVPERFLPEIAHFFYLPISMVVLLLIPYTLAIVHRRTVALHARWMICTSLAMIDPVFGRIFGFYFPPLPIDPQLASLLISLAILAVFMVLERKQRVGRRVFPTMVLVVAVVYALFFTFARTEAWLAFATWFRG
jgi:hypothetical protein